MKKLFLVIPIIVLSLLGYSQTTYYVSLDGDNGDDGSFSTPWASWHYAFNELSAGDTLYIRGGVYYVTHANYYNAGSGVYVNGVYGTAENKICVFNYPGEVPILDGSLIEEEVSTIGIGFRLCGYWHLKGLTIRNFPQADGDIAAGGLMGNHVSNTIFENMISYQNGGAGFKIYGGDGDSMTGNKFINCDAYDNYDPYSAIDGGDADGFSIASLYNLTDSTILIGCRAWNNSDDGFEGWGTEGIIVFQDCWSLNNGYQADGNGQGFKLGDTYSTVSSTYIRQVYNCIAFGNKENGLAENETTGLNKVVNFTSYKNMNWGIRWDGADEASIYRNIISYDNGDSDYSGYHAVKTHDHNSYHTTIEPNGPVADASDFFSLDTMELYKPRKTDGSLPDITFGTLRPSSDLVDAGIDVGLDYNGLGPDLGATEFNPLPYIPDASFSFTKLNCETPYDVQFEDISSVGDSDATITSYHWDFGDGNTSTSENPMHIFNSSGTFIVELSIITDQGFQDTSVDTIVLEVIPPPLVHDQDHCGVESFTGIEGIGEGLKWYSDPSLTTVIYEGNFFFPEITDSGTYTFYVSQTIDNCSSLAETVNVEIYNSYIVHIDSSICESEELFFGGVYINESGTYSDSLLSGNGCDSVLVLELLINENPIIDLGEDTTLTNEVYELSISGIYDEYLWNDGYTGSSQIIDPATLEDGNYLYSLTVTDHKGCKGSDTILITVDGPSWISNLEEAIVNIYPNPAKNILIIETGELGAHKRDITSINGQLIHSEEITDPICQIDLTPLRTGVYFITISSQDFVTTRKIIKQ